MRPVHLRVKIKSLAAEQRIIRDEERRALAPFKRDRRDRRLAAVNGTKIHRVSVDGTPEEKANADRVRAERYELFWSLRYHRWGLAVDVRVALLAYAILRGRAYAVVEVESDTAPDWDHVKSTAVRFGAQPAQVDAWLIAAHAHWTAQHHIRREREKARAAARAAA